jgi:hypothetical protein
MKLILECLIVPPFESNCWILGSGETQAAVVIDPGDEAGILKTLSDFRLISGQWSLTIVSFFLTFLHKEEGYDETPQTGSPFIRFGADRNPTGH